ncbi:hypothetical protein CCACVL1_26478 [Corchorus capsularis]|uniref:Uncharacterized protein n=1 Tax=Corchorus capsularis TaxID=210143 RepID=A0A1R3GEM1_COCAP|nr:hypothetical protein CCACVL1_26478 [Corchorus capsularis]
MEESALINWEADEEEEEALSLCDLPVNLVEEENKVQPITNDENGEPQGIKTEEDFNFGSLGGSLSTEPAEMCAADEVFFKGQILPLRLSVSSDSGLAGFRQDSRRCLSRSESLDHGSLSRFASVSSSSRSSSIGSSHFSRSSSNSNNSMTVTARNFNSNSNSSSSFSSNSNSNSNSKSESKPIKIRNNFNSHPSPKPQIRLSKTRPLNHVSSRNQKSTMWEFFRLGLVRAPELELQDLKVRSNNNNANRNSVSRNSSCNSSNSSSSTKNNNNNSTNIEVAKNQQDLNKGNNFLEKKLGFFSGCKCSVNAVETIPLNNIVIIKSSSNKINHNEKEKGKALMSYGAMEEKKKLLQELKIKKKLKEKEKEKKQEGKQALSRHRTFEWLKELSVSHASYVDEEAS